VAKTSSWWAWAAPGGPQGQLGPAAVAGGGAPAHEAGLLGGGHQAAGGGVLDGQAGGHAGHAEALAVVVGPGLHDEHVAQAGAAGAGIAAPAAHQGEEGLTG
jgi:hypothetical protein